jgi:hypothetical protein
MTRLLPPSIPPSGTCASAAAALAFISQAGSRMVIVVPEPGSLAMSRLPPDWRAVP